MKPSCISAVALLALTSCTESFTTTCSTVRPTTSLNLMPGQGKQLEAAMNAALAKAEAVKELCEVEGECPDLPPSEDKPKPSALKFVKRVFSLPSSIIRGHPHPTLEGLEDEEVLESSTFDWNDSPEDDVVLFPLVGFQFVHDAPNHYGVLPSAHACNPSCRLRQDGEEEVVGWFSKACHLDMFKENYCDDPAE